MAIVIRRGAYADFVPSKLQPGEFADVTSGDPNTTDGKALYICLASGNVVRIASSSEIDAIMTDVDLHLATWSGNLAPEYSSSSGYSVGDFAVHNSILYKCRTTIPAGGEVWNSSHWTQTTIMDLVPDIDTTLTISGDTADAKVTGDKINGLQDQIIDFNSYDILPQFCNYISRTSGNVTYTWDAKKKFCTVSGTSENNTNYDVMYNSTNSVPEQLEKGKTYYLRIKTTNNGLILRVYKYYTDGTNDSHSYTSDGLLAIPDNLKGIIIRIQLLNGTTANNDTISINLFDAKSNQILTEDIVNLEQLIADTKFQRGIASATAYPSCDDIQTPGYYFVSSGSVPENYPYGAGWLIVMPQGSTCLQIACAWAPLYQDYPIQYRVYRQGSWGLWMANYDSDSINRFYESLYQHGSIDVIPDGDGASGTNYGLTYTRNSSNSWTITGTVSSSNNSFRNMLDTNNINKQIIFPERRYKVVITGNTNVVAQVFTYTPDGSTAVTVSSSDEIVMPSDLTRVIVRWYVPKGTTVNETVSISMYAVIEERYETIINQEIHNDTFENTYNINVSPQITTDANGWLQPVDTESADESNKTDMTSAIMAMLTQTGYCHLAPGVYYVSGNIDMPEGSMLEGCGRSTVIRLLASVTEGYAVKMEKYNSVSNLRISGSYSDIPYSSFTADKGTRHGIIFNSQYEEGTRQTEHCTIQNVFIDNFVGCGIKCYNTSISTARGIYVNQAKIQRCQTGVFVDQYSEYNKFEHINTRHCYIACENDGGNNTFIGCTFGATNTGFLIDNSAGDKANNAHGSVIGCTFCHIGDSAGTAIAVKNIVNGFIFSDCQIWYCSVLVEDSYGVAFTGMEFGRGTTGGGATIRINRGGAVIFTGCMFMNDVRYAPDIVVTDNNNVRFTGCYGSNSGSEITVSQ